MGAPCLRDQTSVWALCGKYKLMEQKDRFSRKWWCGKSGLLGKRGGCEADGVKVFASVSKQFPPAKVLSFGIIWNSMHSIERLWQEDRQVMSEGI